MTHAGLHAQAQSAAQISDAAAVAEAGLPSSIATNALSPGAVQTHPGTVGAINAPLEVPDKGNATLVTASKAEALNTTQQAAQGALGNLALSFQLAPAVSWSSSGLLSSSALLQTRICDITNSGLMKGWIL